MPKAEGVCGYDGTAWRIWSGAAGLPLYVRADSGAAGFRGAMGVRQTGAPSPSFLRSSPSFLRRQESMRSVGVKGTPNVRRRPITRGALGAVVGRRAD